jgi:molybdate transport system regulatory protein
MTPKNQPATLRIRVPLGETFAMGPGKADLLQAIQATGSIAAAARSLGLSYRKARLLVEEMNTCFRCPVVETAKGGAERGGAEVTELGVAVLEEYRVIQRLAWTAIQPSMKRFRRHLAPRKG